MKSVFLALIAIALLLTTGCSTTNEPAAEKEGQNTEEVVEVTTPEGNSEPTEEVEKTKTSLTREDMDALFTADPEETQYENSPLEFEYGEVVEVDYISYLGIDGIDYASALFFEDKLVQLQLDTVLTDEELEKILGIDINEDLMVEDKRERGVIEFTFNGRFRESVIAKYPFEME